MGTGDPSACAYRDIPEAGISGLELGDGTPFCCCFFCWPVYGRMDKEKALSRTKDAPGFFPVKRPAKNLVCEAQSIFYE
jgi:hypothetical protein